MSEVANLSIKLSADVKDAMKGLNDADSRMSGLKKTFGGAMGKIAKVAAVGSAAAGAAIGGMAVKGIKDFTAFEGQMNEVFTLLPGMSGDAMGEMTGQVKDFAKEFGVLPDEAVPALYSAISAGVPKDNVFNFLETAQKAAVGGVTDLNTAVDGISSVVNAYGDDVIGAGEASDLMFTAVKKGKTNFEELSSSLFQVIPTASSLGVEFGDVTAALATMTAAGTPTSVATTQLRQAFVELSKEGGAASDTFKEISGKSFKKFTSEGGNVQEALQLMEGYAQDTGVGVNDLFGSVEAGNAVLALTGKGTESFSENLNEMSGSAGATDEAFDTMEQGLGRSFEKIKANLSTLMIDIGEKLAPVVQNLADKFVEYMPLIQEKVEQAFTKAGEIFDNARNAFDTFVNSTLVQSAIQVFKDILDGMRSVGESAMWARIQTAAGNVAQAILNIDLRKVIDDVSEFLDKWSPLVVGILGAVVAFKAITVALAGWKIMVSIIAVFKSASTILIGLKAAATVLVPAIAAISWPVVAAAAAIGALIAIGVALWKNWDTVKEKASQLHNWLQTTFQNIAAAVIGAVGNFINWVVEKFWAFDSKVRGIAQGFKNGVINIFASLWQGAVNIFTSFDTGVRNIVQNMKNGVINIATSLWQGAVNIFQSLWQGAKNIFNSIRSTATNIFGAIRSFVTNTISSMVSVAINLILRMKNNFVNGLNIIKNIFSRIFNTLKSVVSNSLNNVVSSVKNGIQRAYNAVTGFFSKFKSAGSKIIGNIASGITGSLSKVKDSVSGVLGKARDLLPFSPPKDKSSPMAGIEHNGIGEQIAKGIRSGEGEVNKAMRGMLDMDSNVGLNTKVSHELNRENSSQGNMMEQLLNRQQVIMLDSGELVGATYSKYDKAGGNKTQIIERWGR